MVTFQFISCLPFFNGQPSGYASLVEKLENPRLVNYPLFRGIVRGEQFLLLGRPVLVLIGTIISF